MHILKGWRGFKRWVKRAIYAHKRRRLLKVIKPIPVEMATTCPNCNIYVKPTAYGLALECKHCKTPLQVSSGYAWVKGEAVVGYEFMQANFGMVTNLGPFVVYREDTASFIAYPDDLENGIVKTGEILSPSEKVVLVTAKNGVEEFPTVSRRLH